MFKINLDRIGCGQKIPMKALHRIADLSGLDVTADCASESVDGVVLLSSIDRVGRFCNDLGVYCRLAVLHAASDIIVAGGTPRLASVCVEYGPEFSSTEDFAALTCYLRQALKEQGLSLQNLHSVQSEYTYLTISVTGSQRVLQEANGKEGSIYLSRPIGASKLLVLKTLDNEDVTTVANEIFEHRFRGTAFANVAATDITGFGLAGATFNLCSRLQVSARLDLTYRHIAANDVLAVPITCLEAKDLPEKADTAKCRKLQILTRCIEFAGPVLMFAPFHAASGFEKDFLQTHGWPALQIGEFYSGLEQSEVTYRWTE